MTGYTRLRRDVHHWSELISTSQLLTAQHLRMFGCIVSGQLPTTSFTQVSETQFLTNLTCPSTSLHIVVFITEPFPEGYGGAIYFNWPNPQPTWQYLGYISNNKPSAIFKVSQIVPSDTTQTGMFGQSGGTIPQLGINALKLEELEQLVVASDNTAMTVASNYLFVQKMLENFYNYASSFALGQSQMTPSNDQFVSINVISEWFKKFEAKFKMDPNFWKK